MKNSSITPTERKVLRDFVAIVVLIILNSILAVLLRESLHRVFVSTSASSLLACLYYVRTRRTTLSHIDLTKFRGAAIAMGACLVGCLVGLVVHEMLALVALSYILSVGGFIASLILYTLWTRRLRLHGHTPN